MHWNTWTYSRKFYTKICIIFCKHDLTVHWCTHHLMSFYIKTIYAARLSNFPFSLSVCTVSSQPMLLFVSLCLKHGVTAPFIAR